MAKDEWLLSREPEEVARLVRMLGASVNVAILRELARARRKGEGWMYLSEIAERIGEAPGTVSIAVQKMMPLLVEERREKGLRYFRATLTELRLLVDRPEDG
jgi:DNA-binding transcriptional ArsR family regulator